VCEGALRGAGWHLALSYFLAVTDVCALSNVDKKVDGRWDKKVELFCWGPHRTGCCLKVLFELKLVPPFLGRGWGVGRAGSSRSTTGQLEWFATTIMLVHSHFSNIIYRSEAVC
jgi:hypothetical protein